MLTSSEIKPLPIMFGAPPTDKDWEALRAAKKATGIQTLVQFVKAVPGGTGRVLCVDTKPSYITDYLRVDSTDDPQLSEAVAWSLGAYKDPRAVYAADMLSDILGVWVTEAEPEQGLQKVRFE